MLGQGNRRDLGSGGLASGDLIPYGGLVSRAGFPVSEHETADRRGEAIVQAEVDRHVHLKGYESAHDERSKVEGDKI